MIKEIDFDLEFKKDPANKDVCGLEVKDLRDTISLFERENIQPLGVVTRYNLILFENSEAREKGWELLRKHNKPPMTSWRGTTNEM